MSRQTELLTRLQDREFVISAQIDPPSTLSLQSLDNEVTALHNAGIQVIDINSRSTLSLDALTLASRYKELGFEVIPHLTPRDATIFGLLKQIMTSYVVSNIRNYLVITGDPEKIADELKGRYYPDSIETLQAIDTHLRNSNLELNLVLAAAVNQNARDQDREQNKTRQKRTVGTDFFMSQPVFSLEQAAKAARFYHQSINEPSVPLIMGIWPLSSRELLEKIRAGKIEGVVIPNEVYEETQPLVSDKACFKDWSERQTAEIVAYIRAEQLAQGVYIVAPYRRSSEIIPFITSLARRGPGG